MQKTNSLVGSIWPHIPPPFYSCGNSLHSGPFTISLLYLYEMVMVQIDCSPKHSDYTLYMYGCTNNKTHILLHSRNVFQFIKDLKFKWPCTDKFWQYQFSWEISFPFFFFKDKVLCLTDQIYTHHTWYIWKRKVWKNSKTAAIVIWRRVNMTICKPDATVWIQIRVFSLSCLNTVWLD